MSARSIRRAREREIEREAKRQSRIGRKAAVGAGAAVGATVLFAPSAQAATFTVTNTADAGAGSLRQAVIDANATPDFDQVLFASGVTGTISLTTGAIGIYYAVEIQGPGQTVLTVDGGGTDRIFYIDGNDENYDVEISGLTLTNGSTTGGGGAIYNQDAELTLENATISASHADGSGGALYLGLYADVSLRGATLTGNDADGAGGAIYADEDNQVEVRRSLLSNNTTLGDGGAIYLYGFDDTDNRQSLIVDRSVITGNTAGDDGGGVYTADYVERIEFTDSIISNNTADGDGGGVYLDSPDEGLLISNSTFSGNTATTGAGGGAYLYGLYSDSGGRFVIENSTVVGNTAATTGGGLLLEDPGRGRVDAVTISGNAATTGGGVFIENDYGMRFRNTIIANSTSGGDIVTAYTAAPEDAVRFEFSLIETLDPLTAQIQQTGPNVIGSDPALGALGDNGGYTPTMLPNAGSPAIDKGDSGILDFDQVGTPRPFDDPTVANATGGDGADIGAVERGTATEECQGTDAKAFFGTAADDLLTGTEFSDAIHGAGGNDTISSGTDPDCVYGEDGNDRLKGGGGKDLVLGGDGNDRITGGGGKDDIEGEDGNDNLRGTEGGDKIAGNAGKDKIKGAGGDDKLNGGAGADRINCGPGKDVANADGSDKVSGNCEKVT